MCSARAHANAPRAALAPRAQGYAHYTFRTTERPRPSHVLVGVVTLHDPAWVRALPPGQSLRQWHSARCNHMYYLYILSNNYYVHHLFRLRVLDLFDFFLKVDTDVAVTARLPASPAAQMWRARSFFMHTAWPHHDDAECTGNLSDMVDAYVRAESGRCARRLRPAAEPSAWWRDDELGFTGNFLGGWLGFFASAQVLHFSHHWYAYGPHGQWYWRWTVRARPRRRAPAAPACRRGLPHETRAPHAALSAAHALACAATLVRARGVA